MRRDDLTQLEQAVLMASDTVWKTAWEYHGLHYSYQQVIVTLTHLRKKGLIDSRISDAHGRMEWALTDEGLKLHDA